MDYYAVSASSFADYMGVGRSSISHILSGRNKPSLDFVMKIIEAYNEVDLQWLLYGTGSFPKSENVIEEEILVQENPATPKPTSTPTESTEQDLFSQSSSAEKETFRPSTVSSEDFSRITSGKNEIDRIVIFYEDGTFHSYQMKKT